MRVWPSELFDNGRKPGCCLAAVGAFGTQKWQPVDFRALDTAVVIAARRKHAFNLFKLRAALAAGLQEDVGQRGPEFAHKFAKGVCGYR